MSISPICLEGTDSQSTKLFVWSQTICQNLYILIKFVFNAHKWLLINTFRTTVWKFPFQLQQESSYSLVLKKDLKTSNPTWSEISWSQKFWVHLLLKILFLWITMQLLKSTVIWSVGCFFVSFWSFEQTIIPSTWLNRSLTYQHTIMLIFMQHHLKHL